MRLCPSTAALTCNSVRAVSALAGSALAIFCTIGFLNAFGVLIEYYAGHQLKDKTAFQITWLGSFNTFIFFIFTVPAGILVDRIGPTVSFLFVGVQSPPCLD
jgi:MFS family permease